MRKRMIFFGRKARWYDRLFFWIYFKVNYFEWMDDFIEKNYHVKTRSRKQCLIL